MKIRRFVAKDMRTALAQIKEELGVDAVIMSNKKIPEGVELMAAVDYNQAVPPAQFLENNIQNNEMKVNPSNSREVSNDVVSLGQQTQTPNTLSSPALSEIQNDHAPARIPNCYRPWIRCATKTYLVIFQQFHYPNHPFVFLLSGPRNGFCY